MVAALAEVADPDRAVGSARFFKTGPGEYGEGDEFIGVTVPAQRKVAKRFRGVDAETIDSLLASPVHEHRPTALLLLRGEFERAGPARRADWVERYLAAVRAGRVNNWDLVDTSAGAILGEWLWGGGDHGMLLELAREPDLWRRRVGIIGTFAFLGHGDADPTLEVVPLVLDDRRDLIQKASGWMLREMGKRVDRELLLGFLEEHAAEMGRTALSYAVEHLDAEQRAHFRALR
ncbi:DNA alkylation repair protein [Gordonia sp. NPDC003424]